MKHGGGAVSVAEFPPCCAGDRHNQAMDDLHLRAFAAVAEELSFRRAADRLHLSPSALSRQIRELEAELGAPLFERNTRHVRLTAAGEALLPLALDMLARMANAARSVQRSAGHKPEFLLGMRVLGADFHRLLAETVRHAAGCRVRLLPLESSIQRRQLLRGELDIGVVLHPADDRLCSWPVLRETRALALPDEPRFRNLRTAPPEAVAGLLLLEFNVPDWQREDGLPAGAGAYREHAAGIVPSGDLIPGGMAALIADGTHCSFTFADPENPWRQQVQGTGVVIKRLPKAFPKLLTSVVWLKSRADDRDLAPVVAALKAQFPQPVER